MGETRSRVRDPVLVVISVALAGALIYCCNTTNRTNDAPTYLHFHFIGARLWTVPLAFTVLPNDWARVIVQTALNIGAWVTLIWVVAERLQVKWLSWIFALAAAVLAVSAEVRQWNVLILSESIFMSLMLLLVAATLVYLRHPTGRWAGVVGFTAFWLIFARDAADPVMLVAGIGFMLAAIWWNRRTNLILGLVIAALAAGGIALSLAGSTTTIGRTAGMPFSIKTYNATSIIENQVLPNRTERAYFRARGMPIDPAMTALSPGTYVLPLMTDRELIAWIQAKFSVTYSHYVASHAASIAGWDIRAIPSMLTDQQSYPTVLRSLPTDGVTGFIWKSKGELYALLALAAAIGGAALTKGRRLGAERILAVGAVVASFAYCFEVWLLSALELARLSTPASVLLRLALVAIVVWSADLLLTRSDRDSEVVSDPERTGSGLSRRWSRSRGPSAPRAR